MTIGAWLRFWLGLALFLTVGCRQERPSVVLISIDSLRYDDATAVIQGRPVAPALDRLRREGWSFSAAQSTAPWTTPAMMGVMTGLPPPAHGVEEYDRGLSSTVPLLAERFRAAGYQTSALVPENTLRPEFGFGRGFETYDLEPFGHRRLSSPALISKALNRIENWKQNGRPFFLWVHLWDPHYNYNPPPPFDGVFREGDQPQDQDVQCLKWQPNVVSSNEARFFRGQYRGEIAFTDKYVGDLLEYLDRNQLREKILVVVLGDHGEAFQEHGWLGHTNRLDQDVLHVPLIFRWPGRLSQGVVHQIVSTAQVGATILREVGLSIEKFGDLPPLPRPGEAAAGTSPVLLAETVRQACLTSIRQGAEKYIIDHRTCQEQLFDLDRDPGELQDLTAQRPERLAALRNRLLEELDRIAAMKIPRGALPPETVQEAEAALKSLGYVGEGKSGAPPSGCRFAPNTGRRDLFGDTWTERCPSGGLEICLKRKGGR